MDIRIVIGIAVALLLLVIFGKNPMEPPPGWKPPDPFKDGIKSKLQGTTYGGGAVFSGTVGNAPVAPSPAGAPISGSRNYQSLPGQTAPAPAAAPVPLTPTTQPSQTAPDAGTPFEYLPMPSAPPQSSLPAKDAPAASAPPQYKLPGGKPLRFSGSQVFTQDETGNEVLLADGTYKLRNRTIYVRGGRQQFPPNYFSERMYSKDQPGS